MIKVLYHGEDGVIYQSKEGSNFQKGAASVEYKNPKFIFRWLLYLLIYAYFIRILLCGQWLRKVL